MTKNAVTFARQMKRTILILCSLLLALTGVRAQNATSSPSSRFGYGEMNDNAPTAYRGMGGVATGMRRNSAINSAQPASYTVCDSVTFMFDLAGSGLWTRYEDSNGHRNRANGNLECVTLQFPIWKQHIAFSAGVLPYSSVGYNFALTGTEAGYDYTINYEGEGGITNVYAGLGFNILNWFAFGANAYFMFGDVTNGIHLTFDNSKLHESLMYQNMTVRSFRFRYGAQLFHTFADRHEVVLGGVFENRQKLRGSFVQYELNTLDSVLVKDDGFQLPLYYSAGFSYCYDNRLLIAADYSSHLWSEARYFGTAGSLHNRSSINFGVEYRHNPMSRDYAQRMFWRLGASVHQSYVRQTGAQDFTLTLGLGFPLRTSASHFNLALEYDHRRAAAQLTENNLRLTVNIAVAENWFFKRKL